MAFDDISLARTKEIIYALKYLGRDISEKTSLEIIKEFKSTRMVDGVYCADSGELLNWRLIK